MSFSLLRASDFGSPAIARGPHARRAAERVDAHAGIVGQRRQAGQARRVARLFQRVLDEGGVRLLRFGHVEFALRVQCEADRAEDFAEFLEFAGVVGGEDEALGHGDVEGDGAKPLF